MAALAVSSVFAVLILMFVAEIPFAEPLRLAIHAHTQKAMFLVAAVAMGASLYYSESIGFPPCEMCWFQRIAMYPLAVVLLTAIVSRGRIEPRYIVALAGIGLLISIYHYQLQLFPEQQQFCSTGSVSCTVQFVKEFGFVSIPFMAGCGFLAILLLQVAEWRVDYLFRRDLAE